MSITIRRSTDTGATGKMQVIINGEKVAAIDEGESLEVEIPNEVSILKVRRFGVRSNEIEVRDGDVLEIKYKRWHLILLPLVIVFIILIISFPELPYTSTILPISVLFLIATFVPKAYYIQHISIED